MEKINGNLFKITKNGLNEKQWTTFLKQIDLVNEALKKQEIYNVDYKDVNSILSTRMSDVYSDISVTYHRLANSTDYRIPNDLVEADNLIMAFNQVIALDKRLKKCVSINHPFYIEMRAFADEYLELAKVMKELKSYIKKGRKVSENKKVIENPNKIVKTCPCCLRPIAISKEHYMVNHGYRRPGDGCLIGSCYGVSFKPLEESLDGVLFMIDMYLKNIESTNNIIEKADEWVEIKKYNYKHQLIIVKKEDPKFEMEKENKLRELKYELSGFKRNLKSFIKIKDNWKKED